MTCKIAKTIVFCPDAIYIQFMLIGIYNSLGVLFIPIQEYHQATHTVLGTWMAMFAIAFDIFGKLYTFIL